MNKTQIELLRNTNFKLMAECHDFLLIEEPGFGFSIMNPEGNCPVNVTERAKAMKAWEAVTNYKT